MDMGMLDIEARVLKGMFQGIVFPLPLPLRYQAGKSPQCLWIESHRLASFTPRRFSAIGNYVGGDGGSQLPITRVNVLNRLLALVSRRQIEIDVRPFSTAFAEEALKEQIHADGINCGNFQGIADGGIGRATPALHQDVVDLAEID